MSAFQMLILESRHSGDDVANLILPHSSDVAATIQRTARYIAGYGNGAYRGEFLLRTAAVKATATLTFTGQPSDTQTFVLCGTTFTARASGASGNEFNIGATVALTIANLVAAVNASATAKVTASVLAIATSATVATFQAIDPGAAGNGYVLTESLDNCTRVDFAGGSDGTETTLSAGGAS